MRLQVENLSYSYGDKKAIDRIFIHVAPGEFVGIIGPNGSGKSTVLKSIYRGLTPDSGKIMIDGEDLSAMSYRKSALKMAVVTQENELPFDFTVEEIVAMGRFAHHKLLDIETLEDKLIVNSALKYLGMEALAKRSYIHLSGGEKQRVLLARALAQQASLLLLDEPTNHLDIRYQMQIFDLIKHLNIAVLSVIHDLNMAALYCDRLYVLKEGRVVDEGVPEKVLTPKTIHDVYGVHTFIQKHPITQKLSITFLPEKQD